MPDPIALARDLIRCPSVTPAEGGALALIEKVLKGAGFEVQRVTFTEPGTDPIDTLARVLKLPYVLSQGLFVWPFAYDKEPGEMSEYELSLLGDLMPEGVTEVGYLGWRAGIRPDGRWVFFIAGD